jgi:hypothetical protein
MNRHGSPDQPGGSEGGLIGAKARLGNGKPLLARRGRRSAGAADGGAITAKVAIASSPIKPV